MSGRKRPRKGGRYTPPRPRLAPPARGPWVSGDRCRSVLDPSLVGGDEVRCDLRAGHQRDHGNTEHDVAWATLAWPLSDDERLGGRGTP